MSYGRMISMNRGKDYSRRYNDMRNENDNGIYDYDRYRYKDGRFAPKGRGTRYESDSGVYDSIYDRDGRRHYDNGRYAPMRSEYGGDGMKIGFAPPREDNYYPNEIYGHDEEERRRREKERRQHGYASSDYDDDYYFFKLKGKLGRMGEDHRDMPRRMTREIAEEWTGRMKNEDGTNGPHWTMEQVKQLMDQKKELQEFDLPDVYSVMNMMYSDYCEVAKKFNVSTIDFYTCMAKAWLDDKDAGSGKAKTLMYYECVAK